MDASGFGTLARHMADRTVVTCDPRGLGRSTRKDGAGTVIARTSAVAARALGQEPASGPPSWS